jgi:hypothetical protein
VPQDATLSTGVAVYGEYLKEQVAEEQARKSSFEQRGLAVVTTAGTLVTLLFGLAALSTTVGKSDPLRHEEKVWLGVALVLFVLSSIAALATNFPLKYEVVEAKEIEARLNETPIKDGEAARLDVAETEITTLTDAKQKNACKGKMLFLAMVLEVLAVACVGVAIAEVINP